VPYRRKKLTFAISSPDELLFLDIARFWSKIANLSLPHLYFALPFRVTRLEFRWDLWYQTTRLYGLSFALFA